MASSTPIYKAYVGVIPTAKGFGKNLEGELGNANLSGAANRVGDSAGRTLGSRLTGAFKSALKIGTVLTAAVGAAAIGGGISRQLNIEDATKKLEGLGHETKSVDQIMRDALASVKGTAYGLDSAATQAAGAVAAGVKPGKDLEKYLRRTADAATIAGVGMDEMGFVMNKVQTSQQAYTEDLNMLADRGIPIFQWLQEEYGVTAEELKKMVSEGKVDAETYFKVIDENIGGAALKSGESTRGAFKNMLASLSRVGVSLTSGFFPLIREGFVGLTTIFDAVGPKLEEIFSPVWEVLAPMFSGAISSMSGGLADWITNLDVTGISNFLLEGVRGIQAFGAAWEANDGTVTSSGFPGFMENLANIARGVWDELTGGIKAFGAAWEANDGDITSSGFPGFMEQAAYFVRQLWDEVKQLDFTSLSGFFESLGSMDIDLSGLSGIGSGIGPVIKSVADSFLLIARTSPKLLAVALELVADALGFVAEHADKLVPLIPWIVAGFVAYKVALLAVNSAMAANAALDVVSLPLQIRRNVTSMQAAQARLAAANATKAETIADAKQQISSTRVTIAQRLRTISTKAQTAAEKASTIAKKAATVATNLLGKAIKFAMGPVGLLIIGITLLVGALIWFFTKTETGQKLWAVIWGKIKDSAAAVADWFMSTALPLILSAWDAIVAGALWLYDNVIKKAWDGIKVGIQVTADWITNTLVPWLTSAWQAIAATAMWLWNSIIIPVWEGIKIAVAVVITAVVLYVELLKWYWQTVLAPVALWLWNTIIVPVWNGIKAAIGAVVAWFRDTAWPALKAAWDALAAAATWLYQNVILPVWKGIKSAIDAVVSWFVNTAWPWMRDAIQMLQARFEQFKNNLQLIWAYLKHTIINPVVDWFKNTVVRTIQDAIEVIRSKFDTFKNNLQLIWAYLKHTIIKPVVDWFDDKVKGTFQSALDSIKNTFDKTKNRIGEIWDELKKKVREPVDAVINTVVKPVADTYDKVAEVVGAKKINLNPASFGFWKGGVLPGYTPGKDVFSFIDPANGIRLNLSGGEPIMRPEFGRVMGRGWIDRMNAAARSGGVSGVRKALGFATGGVFPGGEYSAAGGAWDWVKKKASGAKDWLEEAWDTITDFIEDPKKAFNSVKDGLLSRVTIPTSGWGDVLKGAVNKSVEAMIEKVSNTGGVDSIGTGTVAGAPPVKGERLTSLSQILGLPRFGTVVTSTTRRGARTAGSGSVSLHSIGKAADFGGSVANMRKFFNHVRDNYVANELIHTPMGGRQLSRGGKPRANFRPVTARMHYNHVHVGAFKGGGIFGNFPKPKLFDQGGYLMPGVNHILNKTGGYETVIPRAESEMLRQMSAQWKSNGDMGTKYVYAPNQVDMEESVERRTRREFETFVDLAQKASRL